MTAQSAIHVGHGGMVVAMEPDAVRAACVARGWSLAELARQACVSRPTLAQALRGKTVRPRTAYKLALALSRADAATELPTILGGA